MHACMFPVSSDLLFFLAGSCPGFALHAFVLSGTAYLSCLEKTQTLHANAIRRVWHCKDNAIRAYSRVPNNLFQKT
jgi:hypothetical protein